MVFIVWRKLEGEKAECSKFAKLCDKAESICMQWGVIPKQVCAGQKEMEDNGGNEEESHRVQYYWGQRDRAGGSVNATSRPLWYCEAATAVAPGRS